MTRRRTVVTALVLGGLVLAVAAGTWVEATAQAGLGGPQELAVSGNDAAPGVAAAALALLAAAVAAGLVGRVGRWVVVAVLAVASGVVTATSIGVLLDPAAPAGNAAAAATGVATLASAPQTSPLVLGAVVLGVAGIALAALVALAGGGWAGDRRHERSAAAPAAGADAAGADAAGADDDPAALWDSLTRGDDAT